MGERDDLSGIAAMTRGDERQARQLRGSLAVIARRTDDPELRQLVVRVLAGQESVRRVFAHPAFWRMAGSNLANLERGLERLEDDERDEVLSKVGVERTDDEVIETMRDAAPPAPPPEPGRPQRDAGRWG